MCASITEDDLEKRVENANGEVIGVVTEVDGEIVRIEPRSGVVDSIRAALGWSRTHEDAVSVHEDAIEEITAETIRLGDEPATESDASGAGGASGADSADAADATEEPTPDDLDADAMGEPRAESPTGIDEAMGDDGSDEESGAGTAVDEMDRGIATDPSEPAVGTEDSMGGPSSGEVDHETAPTESTDATADADTDAAGREVDDAARYSGPESDRGADGVVDEDGQDRSEARSDAMATDATDWEAEPAAGAGNDSDEMDASDPLGDVEDVDLDVIDPDADERERDSDERGAEVPDEMGEDPTDADHESTPGSEVESAIGEPIPDESSTESTDEADADSEAAVADADSEDVAESTANATEGMDLADELEAGIDDDSLEDVGGTDERDGAERTDAGDTRALADELNHGVDIESAADELGTDASDAAEEYESGPMEPSDVVETGVDVESATESKRRSESKSESETDSEPAGGQQTDVETGPETAARRVRPDARASTANAFEAEGESETEMEVEAEADRARGGSRSADQRRSSPVSAAVAAQRATVEAGQDALELGVTTQQHAARVAFEGTLLAQRGGLDVANTATRSYLTAVSAMAGTGSSSDTEQLDDEDLSETLAAHRERVRMLRMAAADEAGDADERVLELLDRQDELLEQCQQRLESE